MQQKAQKIRNEVKNAYAHAIKEQGGCCDGLKKVKRKSSISCGTGYQKEDVKNLPKGVAESSFGCGNPLAFSEIKEGETVLDLGSGAGLDLLIAAEKVGENGRVYGLDMTDEMLARAESNIKKSGKKNIQLLKGIIEEIPLESNSVDWVISNCVINLSPEKDKVFQEIVRVLKPGGKISISDIVANDLPDWANQITSLYNSCISGAISEDIYTAKLMDSGLTQVEIKDRFSYSCASLKGLLSTELESLVDVQAIEKAAGKDIDLALLDLNGKVFSVRFQAQKSDLKR